MDIGTDTLVLQHEALDREPVGSAPGALVWHHVFSLDQFPHHKICGLCVFSNGSVGERSGSQTTNV